MPTLILLCGMVAVSWYAWFAFRTRVNMSAIGSVMVIVFATSLSSGFPPIHVIEGTCPVFRSLCGSSCCGSNQAELPTERRLLLRCVGQGVAGLAGARACEGGW